MSDLVSVTFRCTTRNPDAIREWFEEHGTPLDAALPPRELLARYIYCQLVSNAQWDGQDISVEPVPGNTASKESRSHA